MKNNYRKAFRKLKAINAPVIEGGWNGEDTFRISGECNDAKSWAEYWNQSSGLFGVCDEITKILHDNGLYAEWVNAGVVGVYEL